MVSIDSRLRLLDAHQAGPLALYLVIDRKGQGPGVGEGLKTLEEALQEGTLFVREVGGSGVVPQLLIHNVGKEKVLLVAGDVLKGGKQDRIVMEDQIVEPSAEPQPLRVNCVEAGRWASRGLTFSYAGRAESDLRRSISVTPDQGTTWATVARTLRRSGHHSDTGAYTASLSEDAVMNSVVEERISALRAAVHPQTVGIVAAVGGEVETAEIYTSPRLFERARDRLLHSLVLGSTGRPERPPPDTRTVAAWVRDARTRSQDERTSRHPSSEYTHRSSPTSRSFALRSGATQYKETLFRRENPDGTLVPLPPPGEARVLRLGLWLVVALIGGGCLMLAAAAAWTALAG